MELMYLEEEKLYIKSCKNKQCQKIFFTPNNNQKYCNPKCTKSYIKGKYRFTTKKYFYLKFIRFNYHKLKRRNPLKANQLIKQMLKEEGKEFVIMVLGEEEYNNII